MFWLIIGFALSTMLAMPFAGVSRVETKSDSLAPKLVAGAEEGARGNQMAETADGLRSARDCRSRPEVDWLVTDKGWQQQYLEKRLARSEACLSF